MTIERIVLLCFIAFAALALAPFIFWWSYRLIHESRRRRSMRAVARECGADFHAVAHERLHELEHFRLFKGILTKPPGQRIRNVVTRTFDDHTVTVFDYQWRGYRSGDDIDSTESWTVVHVNSEQLQVPRFDVRPNGLYLKLTANRRARIEADNHPEFSRAYDLSGEEEGAIRDLFSRDVLDLIVSAAHKFHIEGQGSNLILYTNPRKFTLRSLLAALAGGPDEGRLASEEVLQLLEFGNALCRQLLCEPCDNVLGSDRAFQAAVT